MSDISIGFYVRTTADEDRVLQFATLYENNIALPSIILARIDINILELVDGRTRHDAAELLGRKEISAIIVEGLSRSDRLELALKLNMGGSLPPTQADLEHTIKQMMLEGLSNTAIVDCVPWPATAVRKFIKSVSDNNYRMRVRHAIAGIIDDGLTVEGAANKFHIKLDKLKTEIADRNKLKSESLFTLRGNISKDFRRFGQGLTASLKRSQGLYDDGLLTSVELGEIWKHTNMLVERFIKKQNQHELRVKAHVSIDKQAAVKA